MACTPSFAQSAMRLLSAKGSSTEEVSCAGASQRQSSTANSCRVMGLSGLKFPRSSPVVTPLAFRKLTAALAQ